MGEGESVWGVEGSSRLKSWGPDRLRVDLRTAGGVGHRRPPYTR